MTLHLSAEELVAHQKRQQKAWRAANPDKVKAYNAKHNARDSVKLRKKAWQDANKDRINQARRDRYRELTLTDKTKLE